MIGRIHVEIALEPPYGFPLEDGTLAPIVSSVIPFSELGAIPEAFEQARRQVTAHIVQTSQEMSLGFAQELERVKTERDDEKAQREHFEKRVKELEEGKRGAS